MSTINKKICQRCFAPKPSTTQYFRNAKEHEDGLSTWCISCLEYKELEERIIKRSHYIKNQIQNQSKKAKNELKITMYTNNIDKVKSENCNLKQCSTCKEFLPDNSKYFYDIRKKGRMNQCKQCFAKSLDPSIKKECIICGEFKPATLEYFPYYNSSKQRLRNFCKECNAKNITKYKLDKKRLSI